VPELRRSVLPSIAITCPSVTSCSVVIQESKHFSNSAGLSAAKMALKRSCDGTPAERSRNLASHSRLARAQSAIATKSSAPLSVAHNAITTTFASG